MESDKAVYILSPSQSRVVMSADQQQEAIDAAVWLTASPHEWQWTHGQQVAMARFVLWATQRLDGIRQLATNHETGEGIQ